MCVEEELEEKIRLIGQPDTGLMDATNTFTAFTGTFGVHRCSSIMIFLPISLIVVYGYETQECSRLLKKRRNNEGYRELAARY